MKVLILGGNRFFGRHLAQELLQEGHTLTLLNRGQIEDGLGKKVERLKADRGVESSLSKAIDKRSWDLVYDQICYTANEANLACHLFRGKTPRYIVTSSESIYDSGEDQREDNFKPQNYLFEMPADPKTNYQEAKRQVEAVFASDKSFEVAIVRPSLVVGQDDYTKRLLWHLDRINSGLPMYFPNLDIRSDFIRSDQAGNALKIIGLSQLVGPINLTTRGSLSLRELVTSCEAAVNKKSVLSSAKLEDSQSPYGGAASKTMNTDALYSLGFHAETSSKWMPELIRQMAVERGEK